MTTPQEILSDVQGAFDNDVVEEIFDQYRQAGNVPSDKVKDAIGTIWGKSRNEVDRKFREKSPSA